MTVRRTRRDWLLDLGAFLLAAGAGALMSIGRVDDPTLPHWMFIADQITGAVACAALWLRRRYPFALGILLMLLTTYSETAGAASAVALFTVTVRRPVREGAIVAALGVLTIPVFLVLRPDPDAPWWYLMVFGTAVTLAVFGWGIAVRQRLELIQSLRDRAARAESEAALHAEAAQALAREQIAREMHDVLGHRLSLLSVQAGALEYRKNAAPGEVAQAASVIRASAHQALQDLREVIGVLRAPVGELPQPTFADLDELVAESRRAGMRVTVHERLDTAVHPVPDSLGRTAYRIVQEALTNARKHAPGADVTVELSGCPRHGMHIEVANAVPPLMREEMPPATTGQGLIGLTERAALAGGYLAYQQAGTGMWLHGPVRWRLWAWLPWPGE
ncbi:histidine kinase [Pseudonocardia eucalypti]|uniref:histidine kinase n=1 Tax=Pseudonocardia eucalypti TaxID=648755 RepID=A0ABP9QL88_9PSEU|nr:signal transduction histidine kinase [Pseudonocardia eucalypti]